MTSREQWINTAEKHAHPLRSSQGWEALIEKLKDKKIVMLGEATHGTSEFYDLRRQISETLVREHGFRFIAVEGDWPDGWMIDQCLHQPGQPVRPVLEKIHRWPRWMWANEDVIALIESLKGTQARFFGLDVYSLYRSIDEVIQYVKRENPLLARRIQSRYSCFDPFDRDEIAYARSLSTQPSGCEAEACENLADLLRMRIAREDDSDNLFNAQQNARIVRGAEAYYRAMLKGDAESWNIRDRHMMQTLDLLLEKFGPNSKAIVWAHNTHIGDYSATDMWADGYINIGGLAREKYGRDPVALVGFGTYRGTVLAGLSWGALEAAMELPPAREGSCEELCHETAQRIRAGAFYLLFDDELRSSVISGVIGHRAVGVVYDPAHERRSQYVPSELTERYDAFVFVDRTTAVRPLHGLFAFGELPETWPSGQ